LLSNVVAERDIAQAQLNMKVQDYLLLQSEVTHYIEEAFIEAELIELPEEPENNEVKDRDVEEEYRKLCEPLEPEDDMCADYDLHDFADHFKPAPLTPEEQVLRELQTAHDEARVNVRDAQQSFDRKDALREVERQMNEWKLQHSQEAETQAAFDVRWVQKNRDFTRQLINAEDAVVAARKAAIAGGLELEDDDQSSDFGDEDGAYPPSVDEQLIAFAPRNRVSAWIASIAGAAPPSDIDGARIDVELDEWDAEEVEIGDSYSTVAEPEGKKKIRRWQESCQCGRSC